MPSVKGQLAKGKLWDCYNNTRSKLSKLGVIKRREKTCESVPGIYYSEFICKF